VTAIVIAFFYVYTLLMYTNTRSVEAELFSKFKTPTPEVGLQNLRACGLRSGFYLILELLVDVCN